MSLDALANPPDVLASPRFFRTAYLPTYAVAVFLIALVWAGAPGQRVHFDDAWATAKDLGVLEAVLIALAVVLVAVVLQPLQTSLVRLLEGDFPRWLGASLRQRRHVTLRTRMAERATAALTAAVQSGQQRLINEAGEASARLRSRYPAEHAVRATRLGNVLAATADTAGQDHGLDPIVVWPHLYPLLGENIRGVVDDLRDALDAAVRMCVVTALTSIAAAGLLVWRSGWWTLLALVPLGISVLSYAGAVRAAVAYGAGVRAGLDLHRFDLRTALHLPLPRNPAAERIANEELCDLLRQGVPLRGSYEHPPQHDQEKP
ncbi:hypothetical protein Q0Z83_017180 [Actinoplanes sichuanensis]|uniref:Uncharacterized protein n=1 Tax=Actinoplanes sichuanensis TaxID=512349 RepID=A0ABW4A871_9ACTN|nr:hypothetical protein [Actinoplanes sichuanensis]BEL03527.1 hypothetical protein Q0Z83_017180 [Actinoplanes sichuanensis]